MHKENPVFCMELGIKSLLFRKRQLHNRETGKNALKNGPHKIHIYMSKHTIHFTLRQQKQQHRDNFCDTTENNTPNQTAELK